MVETKPFNQNTNGSKAHFQLHSVQPFSKIDKCHGPKWSNDPCVKLWWSTMDHGFAMPPSFPQEFLNRICTWSCSLKGSSIRFLDDWWTWFIESQLLYSQWDNWVTLWANWLLCYGMHHGKATWSPDRLSQTAIRYHVAPMKHLMAVSSLQEMALLISLRFF